MGGAEPLQPRTFPVRRKTTAVDGVLLLRTGPGCWGGGPAVGGIRRLQTEPGSCRRRVAVVDGARWLRKGPGEHAVKSHQPQSVGDALISKDAHAQNLRSDFGRAFKINARRILWGWCYWR